MRHRSACVRPQPDHRHAKNPWNTDPGTGGSSSGPASAVTARSVFLCVGLGHRGIDPRASVVLRRGRNHAGGWAATGPCPYRIRGTMSAP
ncbi:MAG: hypothetical protein J4F40_10570 [Alphaproteobacteria bacterium]|nr:hypothetical protein [Alphaproteobacteria bacterium]